MRYKAVYTDVDGTLIAPSARSKTKASKRLQEKVAQLRNKGIVFGLSTARSLDLVEGLIDSLSIVDPIILDNGARIFHQKRRDYIVNNVLAKDKLTEVVSHLRQFDEEIVVVDSDKRFEIASETQLDHAVKCMMLHLPPKVADEIYNSVSNISEIAVTKSISQVDPLGVSIHITHPKARKDKALQIVCEYLDIEASEVIGIGDSHNDREFLMKCGLKVAVENATDNIRAIADYIAPSYEDDGVATVIEKFILGS